MFTKDEAYRRITELTERFEGQLETYKRPDYNETMIRRNYIDPFFKALGWDVDNSQGYFEAYREVIHEDRVTVSGKTKAPDYSFRLPGGKKLFFVEAKKPSVMVKNDIQPAYQVRRYGWSAKLPVSIVTDFEEFALYDCTKKPSPTDKASTARLKYFTYKDYHKEFDFFWDTFSKERVLRGGLDKFIISDKIKKGTATVDKEFLLSLDEWRKELALNIALRNQLTADELNFVVQAFLDRLIFLRIAEDRNAEEYASLRNCIVSIGGEKNVVYTRLLKLFAEADSKYNSGIFNFKADTISRRLEIDNVTLRKIIQQLYYPDSPYEFSQISVEILGNAYEQFLGKQIILKSAHRATIEEKPEVRKAGGVYYTPQYIVDYIVENTLGKLLSEVEKTCEVSKTSQVSAVAKLKIVDPACGSGSFLLGAYERLLKWHLDNYLPEFERLSVIAGSTEYTIKQRNDAIKERQQLPLTPDGHLTTALKKQILLNNIYGVDIDLNAVEVTKLSLLLKCMEGETQSSITAELRFGERVLPSLENNIRCGNSLIDVDFYESFPDADAQAVKPFNWQAAFPQVFKQGGFDAVIGNPPYIGFQEGSQEVKRYYTTHYKGAIGKYDHYILFMERGIQKLLRKQGIFSMILPNKFMLSGYGEAIKGILLQYHINEIVDFNDIQIFSGATTYPCIINLSKDKGHDTISYKNVAKINSGVFEYKLIEKDQSILTTEAWIFTEKAEEKIFSKLKHYCVDLGSLSRYITQGLRTGSLKVFHSDLNQQVVKEFKIEKDLVKLVFHGKNVKAYRSLLNPNNDLILFPYSKDFVTPVDIQRYPNAKKYLEQFKSELAERKDSGKVFKNTSKKWFEYWDPKPSSFESPKIIFPDISNQNNFFLDEKGIGYLNTCYAIFLKDEKEYKYILGLLNSFLIEFFIKKICPFIRGGFYRYKTNYIAQIPIKIINESSKREKSLHDEIVKLVETMLLLNQQLQEVTLPHQKEQLQQRIAFTDKKIDALVYELYGLTEEEIKIVENG